MKRVPSRLAVALARPLLGLLCAVAVAQAQAQTGPRELWLTASIGGADAGLVVLVLVDADGRRLLRRLDLGLLGIAVPQVPAISHQGEWFVPETALAGHRLVVDESTGRLDVQPAAASAVVVTTTPPAPPPVRSRPETQASTGWVAPPPAAAEPAPVVAPAVTEPAAPPADAVAWLLDVEINGRPVSGVHAVSESGGRLWLSPGLLEAAGVRPPPGARPGEPIALDSLAVGTPNLDTTQLRLAFEVDPDRLPAQRMDLADDFRPGPPPGGLSAVIGYDLGYAHATGSPGRLGAALDAALSAGRATCGSGLLVSNRGDALRRGDSRCQFDWPERMMSLTVGDAIGGDSALLPPVRYGGVRIGSDFETNPYFNTRPLLAVEGSARLPSTVELYLDQQLALRSEIAPGPFRIEDLPAHTANGELRVVVTDALGRQSVTSAPVFVDPRLLRPGLVDWSAEAGRLRLDYLGEGDRYGERFASARFRRGISDRLTVGGQVQVREEGGLVGAELAWQAGARGMLEAAVAASRDDDGAGLAWLLGYAWRGRALSFGLRHWQADDGFSSLAWDEPGQAPERLTQGWLGWRVSDTVSLSLSLLERRQRALDDQRLATLGLNLRLWHWSQLLVSVSHPLDGSDDLRASLVLSVPFGRGYHGRAGVHHDGERTGLRAGVQSPWPDDTGVAWRLDAEAGGHRDSLSGSALWRGRRAQAQVAGFHDLDGATSLQAGLTGSVLLAGGGVHLARPETGSYALVRVPQAGVRVLRDNRVVAVTGDDGVALVPGLRPFQRNRVALEGADLPLSLRTGHAALDVVPGRRQVVTADFAATRVRWLSLRIALPGGAVPPPGAAVRGAGLAGDSVLGFEGELFLELAADVAPDALVLSWPGATCQVRLPTLQWKDELAVIEEILECA
ncbi:MAG: fimbrial biogenesis outer membrane usher protein [Xanthomonadales bacterium]|nr:fimbrial biogenesis outer membrane usher protein [Xanthomonadales bacterium]